MVTGNHCALGDNVLDTLFIFSCKRKLTTNWLSIEMNEKKKKKKKWTAPITDKEAKSEGC